MPTSCKAPDPVQNGRPITKLPLPPAGFNPLAASEEDLALFGFPPRPDPDKMPLLYKAFAAVFSPPLIYLEARLEAAVADQPIVANPTARARVSGTGGRYETSLNWCGAYIMPNDGNMFVQVVGAWTVPTPSRPPPIGKVIAAAADSYDSATWIGLDGQRRYLDSSLPQIGTDQTFDAVTNQPQTQAWVQWFAEHELVNNRYFIPSCPVHPGDEVACMIWVKAASRVNFYFHNLSNHIHHRIVWDAPLVQLPDKTLVRPVIAGATAEWIMERPRDITTKDLHPLAGFTPTEFMPCIAGFAPAPGPPVDAQDISTPRLIRMYERLHAPERTVFTAMPYRVGDLTLLIRYGDDFIA